MGPDVIIGIVGIASLSVLAYLAGGHLGRTVSKYRPLLFVESILLSLVFAWTLEGKLGWAIAIPNTAVICWSNFMPVLLGFTAGLARWSSGLGEIKRPIVVGVLGMIAAAYMLAPVVRPIAAPANVDEAAQWRNGICLQSHPSTCGAASAATLLRRSGVRTSEAEMIKACLTSNIGTVPLGLYRGIALKANRSNRVAAVASRKPKQWSRLGQLPNVALVRFDSSEMSGSPARLLGPQGEGHAVAVIGRTDGGRWIIGDPAVGLVYWSDAEFESYFTGDAIYLKEKGSR
tara:strand:+ start:20436 stop:21299 length:864 start_codon:yes stop_codon:yes gene_type:complete